MKYSVLNSVSLKALVTQSLKCFAGMTKYSVSFIHILELQANNKHALLNDNNLKTEQTRKA